MKFARMRWRMHEQVKVLVRMGVVSASDLGAAGGGGAAALNKCGEGVERMARPAGTCTRRPLSAPRAPATDRH